MLKSRTVWLAALWIGVMIHLDWHLGRSGHDHRSFDLDYHWLLAFPTFVPVALLSVRKWPMSDLASAAVITALGILLGQGLEPLSEVILFDDGLEPFRNAERWRVFAEFMSAGLITLLVSVFMIRRVIANPRMTDPE